MDHLMKQGAFIARLCFRRRPIVGLAIVIVHRICA